MLWRVALPVGLLGLIAVLTAVYLVTGLRLIWTLIGLLSVAAMVTGVRRHRPPRPLGWWLVAAALLVLTAGDTVHFVLTETVGRQVFPSVADVVYLLGFLPLLATGVWVLARSGVWATDRVGLLDALIITVALALLAWTILVQPIFGEERSIAEWMLLLAYPATAVFVLITVIRWAVAVRWTLAVALPTFGTVGMLLGDAIYGFAQVRGAWIGGGAAALGWFALYAGWGAGALHPSMAALRLPWDANRAEEMSFRRLAMIAITAVAVPVVVVAELARGLPPDRLGIGVLGVMLSLLVLGRLYGAINAQRRGLARERELSRLGSALVAATTVEEVRDAVGRAVTRLLPHGARHRTTLELAGEGGAVTVGGVDRAPVEQFEQAAPFRPRRRTVRRVPAGRSAVIRWPLTLSGPEPRDIGALVVETDARNLRGVQATMEVLAAQTALALERVRLTERINRHASEAYFRALVQNAADVILIVDEGGKVRYASPSARALLGELPRSLEDIAPRHDPELPQRLLRQSGDRPEQTLVTAEWSVRTPDGREVHLEALYRDLRHEPTVGGVVVTLRDVTEQRRLQQELTHLAYHDPLTGLPNRALLYERLDWALAQATADGALVGVLLVDVDDLKLINDTLGHAAGDAMLRTVGQRMSGAVGPGDTPARLGGDEFAALIESATDPAGVEQIAQDVVEAFREPFLIAGREVRGSVSVGVATTATAAATRDDLLRQADLALYDAKSAGKGTWSSYRESLARPDRTVPEPDRDRRRGARVVRRLT